MKMYRVERWDEEIKEVEVDRVTNTTVFSSKHGREAIVSSYHRWFHTKPEAISYLIDKHNRIIEGSEKVIASSKRKLIELNQLSNEK